MSLPCLAVCCFISSGSLENCFFQQIKTMPELWTDSCKIAPSSLPSNHALFWVSSKRQNRLLTLPENLGDRFCCWGCRGEQNPQIAYPLFSGQELIFGAMWVGFEELFCFCFKALGKKTLDFEILFSYVLAWENWPPTSTQSTLSTFIFN